jgi:hypothetical protein
MKMRILDSIHDKTETPSSATFSDERSHTSGFIGNSIAHQENICEAFGKPLPFDSPVVAHED